MDALEPLDTTLRALIETESASYLDQDSVASQWQRLSVRIALREGGAKPTRTTRAPYVVALALALGALVGLAIGVALGHSIRETPPPPSSTQPEDVPVPVASAVVTSTIAASAIVPVPQASASSSTPQPKATTQRTPPRSPGAVPMPLATGRRP
jgi:hypothetical protein